MIIIMMVAMVMPMMVPMVMLGVPMIGGLIAEGRRQRQSTNARLDSVVHGFGDSRWKVLRQACEGSLKGDRCRIGNLFYEGCRSLFG